jgi:hypothetical protein
VAWKESPFIKPSIIHLMCGQMFNIDGTAIFTFGGVFDKNAPDFHEKIREANEGWELYRILDES